MIVGGFARGGLIKSLMHFQYAFDLRTDNPVLQPVDTLRTYSIFVSVASRTRSLSV